MLVLVRVVPRLRDTRDNIRYWGGQSQGIGRVGGASEWTRTNVRGKSPGVKPKLGFLLCSAEGIRSLRLCREEVPFEQEEAAALHLHLSLSLSIPSIHPAAAAAAAQTLRRDSIAMVGRSLVFTHMFLYL